jgi:hypothetical protein
MPDMPWKGDCVIMEVWCQMARIPSRMQQLTSSCALGAISSIVLVALVWASTTEILLNVLLGVIYFWVSFALREVKRIVCPLWWAVKRIVSLACRVAKRIGSPMCCLPMAWRGGSQQPVGWDVELGLAATGEQILVQTEEYQGRAHRKWIRPGRVQVLFGSVFTGGSSAQQGI